MSIKTCKQHSKDPVFIYAACAGCEIQRYRDQEKVLKAENEALRADAERYRKLSKVTPYRFKKMQEASVTDGGDVLYFHADRFSSLLDAISSPENP